MFVSVKSDLSLLILCLLLFLLFHHLLLECFWVLDVVGQINNWLGHLVLELTFEAAFDEDVDHNGDYQANHNHEPYQMGLDEFFKLELHGLIV